MKSSFHSLIHFLPLLCNCQLNSILVLASTYPVRLRNSTQFFRTELFFVTTLRRPRRKHSLSIVGKACLQGRCIATEVTSLLRSNEVLFVSQYNRSVQQHSTVHILDVSVACSYLSTFRFTPSLCVCIAFIFTVDGNIFQTGLQVVDLTPV
jgi:hypothetical protein